MGKINYRGIYETNQDEWKALTREPQKYEALLAGHYSESNHFVYELLQNAEDENADRVVIEYYDDKLIFYHNGDAFDEDDVRGVSSMLKGTKDKSSAQTIGRFGMGFKSVFKYTYQPEIYSDEEAFRIENYLLPVEIESEWNFREAKENLSYRMSSGGQYRPFVNQEHLTKIVISFYKRQDDGDLKKVSGKEVLQKLEQLTGEILLFLNHIKRLFWINKGNNKYGMISLDEDQTDKNLLTCRIEGSSYGNKEEITRYLKFKKVFDHENMTSAEVSVAYKVNNRANNVNELIGQVPVWVYFPTRDMTKLPFYIHGSFETAVSREKLMTPSQFNADMFEQLGNLIQDSLLELKKRNLITQVFIRRVLLAAFRDEAENDTIPGLRNKISRMFQSNALLPDRQGVCRNISELYVPVPFQIGEFADSDLLGTSLSNVDAFVAFNNEKEANFNEYFGWLTDELKVKVYTIADWARKLKSVEFPVIDDLGINFKETQRFYDFLSDNRESLYTTGLAYSRSGRYELRIRQVIENAWEELRQAPIILNATGAFVPAYRGEEQVLYLNGKNDYQTLMKSAIVHHEIADSFTQLLKDGFKLSDFDNFQYVKEKVVKKYINGDKINFESDAHTSEYVEDLNQIFALFENNQNVSGVLELLSRASIIKIKTEDGSNVFAEPSKVYVSRSTEGVNLAVYYEMPEEIDDDEEDYDCECPNVYLIDEEFYANQGISLKKLQQFGLITTPITEGKRSDPGGPGQESWRALGEYCPRISVDFIDENLEFIEYHSGMELAKRKSTEILKLMIAINEKLSGRMRKRKSNPYEIEEESYLLHKIKRYRKWLYDKSGNLHTTSSMSKFELDEDIYGQLQKDKDIYSRLGFMETEEDSTAEAFDQVDKLDDRNKKLLLRQLARELGMKVSDKDEDDEENVFTSDDENDGVFDGNDWVSDAFPVSRVRNMETLIEHVKQQFFCADPVRYEKALRQIRTSKSSRTVRAYVSGMYMNDSNVKICQMCKKAAQQIDATEIANFGIELPQLNLCLCRECSGIYKSMRDVNKEAFKEGIKQTILGLNLEEKSDEYEVQFNADMSLHFTETHVAEIQTIFGLLSEFGTPGINEETDNETIIEVSEEESTVVSEPEKSDFVIKENVESRQADSLMYIEQNTQMTMFPEMEQNNQMEFAVDFTPNTQPIKDGDLVSYKKMNTLEIVDAVMDSTKYPLHKSFIGKKIGDVVVANGKRFLIVSIL